MYVCVCDKILYDKIVLILKMWVLFDSRMDEGFWGKFRDNFSLFLHFCYFSIKMYVVGAHNIRFYGEL